ncbi:hypothetical protein TSAR_010581 [Trichomalopsis sarcophagae]|uniref:RNA-directed DNA polymerase n=1 Tax=Trichomalopsis sarcophagae TaxID=543379 RepID=A0A232ED81_9HYME|nr:hypothetical protein TSAR_010581 [Trichomalopsis sarcophagae]
MATNCSVSAFWREQPELWFIQTEALFEKHKVTDDTMKFNTVVGALDVRTIDDLQDVIRNPPANNTKYATLKETIIKRTTESPDNNLLKLLTNLELGDSKPSQLWRKMQSLADGKILEPALKVMWLAHLPAPAQTYLSVFKVENVEDLLEAADKIITGSTQVTAVTASDDTSNASSGYGTSILFLVDTGSVATLIPKADAEGDLQKHPLTLHAANQTQISTYGTRRLELSLGLRRNFTCNAIIADVPHAILGADFLIQHGLVVDVKGRRIVDAKTLLASRGALKPAAVSAISSIEAPQQNKGALAGRYDALLKEFADVFDNAISPTCTPGFPVKHVINTTGPPVAERYRRLMGERLQAAHNIFMDLLNKGVIRPGSGKWASPLHLVPKGATFTAPGNVFSTIDLRHAFYQIPIDEDSIEKTTVTTPFGLYEFLGTSLGLRNATQTMQRAMDHILRKLPFAKAYVDDIFIASNNHEEHLQHLQQLLQALREAKLKANTKKCIIGQPQSIFWGYRVTKDGFQPPPAKVEAIRAYPRPTTATELRRFLGICNYYRRCLPHAAAHQAPLHEMLKRLKTKKTKLKWSEEAERAFQQCKASIADAACTTFFEPDAELALRTDASDTAIGAAIEQRHAQGDWRPLGFFSQKLTPTQQRYSTYDRELLAVYEAIKHFERMLEGRTYTFYTVYTDHRPLIYAAQQRADKASPRQARQLEYILRFNVKLAHTPGKANQVADALSRATQEDAAPATQTAAETTNVRDKTTSRFKNKL